MIHLPESLLGCAAFTAVGWLVTRPVELRPRRWQSIALSLPFAFLGANTLSSDIRAIGGLVGGLIFFAGVMSAFFLAFIWKDVLAHFAASLTGHIIYGDMNARSGGRCDFRAAKSFQRFGELREAIQEARAELKKEPMNYEGLLLLAGLHEQNGTPAEAVRALETALKNPDLNQEQQSRIQQYHRTIEERLLVEEMNRR